jgi:Mg2+-importing ATPase
MLFLGPISSIFDYVTYAALLFVFDSWNNPSLFQTGWFEVDPGFGTSG